MIDLLSEDLLRAHVEQCPNDCSRFSAGLCNGLVSWQLACRAEHLSQTKVQHLNSSSRRKHQVGGLDIPVDHALTVGFFQGIGHLKTNLNCLSKVQPTAFDPVSQRFTFSYSMAMK